MTVNNRPSDLTACFTLWGDRKPNILDPESRCNYDWPNSHRFPQLALDPAEGPSPVMATVLAFYAYLSLRDKMTPSKGDLATIAGQEATAYGTDAYHAVMSSNRPDNPPTSDRDMTVDMAIQVGTKDEPMEVHVPLGTLDLTAWNAPLQRNPGYWSPPLPQPAKEYRHQPAPYQETETDRQVFAFLAGPWFGVPRNTRQHKSDRLARLMAKFWEHGDGKDGTQPIMPENAALRAARTPQAA